MKLKKLTAMALAFTMLCSMSTGCKKDEKKNDGALDMGTRSTMEYVYDMGIGINLGNTFDCAGDWHSMDGIPEGVETAWGSPIINKDIIQAYADAGFGVMRLPVSWSSLMDEDGNIDEPWLDRIDEVVGWILDTGMYCILNSHHDSWPDRIMEDREKGMKIYENVWTQVATRFDKYGEKLMFESMNEVGFDKIWNRYGGTEGKQEAYDLFNQMNKRFVEIVRSTGKNNPKRHLLIASYWTDIERACDDMYILPDDPANRIAVSVHYYTPSTLCILDKDADWGKAQTEWGSEKDYEELNTLMDMMKENFVDKGIPVIIGEYGCFGKNKTKEVKQLWTYEVAKATRQRKMCPILWDTPGDEMDRREKKLRDPEFIQKLVNIGKEF